MINLRLLFIKSLLAIQFKKFKLIIGVNIMNNFKKITKSSFIIIAILILIFNLDIRSQVDSCGTLPFSGETSSPSTFIGGRYKPHRTDIGGSPVSEQLDYFPILVVYIQYQGETGGNFPGNPDSVDAWPAGRAPNYLNRTITRTRATNSSSWWDSYNGYDINDYWHEFSRGKLHIRGEAYSVILPHTKSWYDSNCAQGKMNKDVFDYLKDSTLIDWTFYDKWTTVSEGNFSWQPDQLIDMIYLVFRNRTNAYLGGAAGEASIGSIQGADTAGQFTVYQRSGVTVKVQGGSFNINCSGHRTDARGDLIFSRHTYLGVSTHEHGHYLFGGAHETYCHMAAGPGGEFSFSPWEMVKMGYIQPFTVNYFNPTHLLYDYSSRYGSAGSSGEVLQVPISSDGNEFFLLANRRKVSEYDIRMTGDTLAEDGNYHFKKINPQYGKGLYIYHIKGGYEYGPGDAKDMDLECADGLWNWEITGLTRPPIWNPNGSVHVYKKTTVSYNNDLPGVVSSLQDRDDISFRHQLSSDDIRTIWHSPGKADLFNPVRRGTDRLFTNDMDYLFTLPVYGDRFDAWNVGYNEVFSPYSSPNTNNMSNDSTGIFIWYKAIDTSSKEATLKIYRSGQGGYTRNQILEITPPSKPMGIVVEYFIETENFVRPLITWNHNKEPDMLSDSLTKRYKIWRATATNVNYVPTDYTLLKTLDIDSDTTPSYLDTSIKALGSAWPGMGELTEYPVRYTVQAIDKYADSSVRSDFGSIIGIKDCFPCTVGERIQIEAGEIPDNFKLYENYPNPFNPETKIKFDLPIDNYVKIKVYDILGKEVFTLVNEFKQSGRYIVSFNAGKLPSGIYYCWIKAGEYTAVRKMLLIK